MANVLAVAAFVCCFVGMNTGTLVWTAVMLPGPVGRARARLEECPLLCLVWGLFLTVAWFVALAFLIPQRDAGFRIFSDILGQLAALSALDRFSNDARILTHVVGWLLLTPLMVAWVVGGAGFARLFTSRAVRDLEVRSPVRCLVGGSLCTSAAYLFPFVGWFVFLPVVGAMSVGAGAMAMAFRRPGKGAPAACPSAGEVHETV